MLNVSLLPSISSIEEKVQPMLYFIYLVITQVDVDNSIIFLNLISYILLRGLSQEVLNSHNRKTINFLNLFLDQLVSWLSNLDDYPILGIIRILVDDLNYHGCVHLHIFGIFEWLLDRFLDFTAKLFNKAMHH